MHRLTLPSTLRTMIFYLLKKSSREANKELEGMKQDVGGRADLIHKRKLLQIKVHMLGETIRKLLSCHTCECKFTLMEMRMILHVLVEYLESNNSSVLNDIRRQINFQLFGDYNYV